jgi:ABC-type antimicrobial peptide transport system permease subunit
VNPRKREIGLRIALGAARASVLRLILKQGMALVLTGVLIGFAAALFVGRLLSRMLFGVSASDPISVAGAVAVGLLACYLPAPPGKPRRSIGGAARGLTADWRE